MKQDELALAAAELAESRGWGGFTSEAVAAHIGMHPKSLARRISRKDLVQAAQDLVRADGMRYPRAAVELRMGELSHNQRCRVLHALAKEIAK
tara:strand:+ start:72 stop:350 length:279 start_codon:yes stop_codon:yes gene_type:complete